MTTEEIDALYAQYKRDIVEYWESEANLGDPSATDKHALALAVEREREKQELAIIQAVRADREEFAKEKDLDGIAGRFAKRHFGSYTDAFQKQLAWSLAQLINAERERCLSHITEHLKRCNGLLEQIGDRGLERYSVAIETLQAVEEKVRGGE